MALQKGKQWTRPPLAFIRYYDSPVANDWRRHNGDKAQSAASKDRQLKESKNGCAMLEACHTYGKGLAKFPWVAVIVAARLIRGFYVWAVIGGTYRCSQAPGLSFLLHIGSLCNLRDGRAIRRCHPFAFVGCPAFFKNTRHGLCPTPYRPLFVPAIHKRPGADPHLIHTTPAAPHAPPTRQGC